jgi:hypothetical protein
MPEPKAVEIRNPRELTKTEISNLPKKLTRLRGGLADRNPTKLDDKKLPLDEFEIRRKQFFGA